jgi:hypothetical protein
VGFEHTIPASERAKTVHASDRAATVTGKHSDNFTFTLRKHNTEKSVTVINIYTGTWVTSVFKITAQNLRVMGLLSACKDFSLRT